MDLRLPAYGLRQSQDSIYLRIPDPEALLL